LRQSHRYANAGTYGVSLTVTDKDRDSDTEQAQVPILTVHQALSQIIDQLKGLIAGTTDPAIRRKLEGARRALEGAIPAINQNGADGQLDPPTARAASSKVDEAVFTLTAAGGAGADVKSLIALLQQIAAFLEAV
jgi:PKD repeat protein